MLTTLILGNWLVNTLTTLFILVCIFLVLVILIQKPKGGGLSGAFGGAGGGGAVFGAKAGDALTWFTVAAFSCFLLLAIALVYATRDEPLEAVVDEPGIETEQIEREVELPDAPPPDQPGVPPTPEQEAPDAPPFDPEDLEGLLPPEEEEDEDAPPAPVDPDDTAVEDPAPDPEPEPEAEDEPEPNQQP